jgi:hypothetical protein
MDHRTFLPNYIEIRLLVSSELRSQDIYAAKAGQCPVTTLKVGQVDPKVNQVRSMGHKTFLPNYIEIRPVVFFNRVHKTYTPRPRQAASRT